MLGEARITSIEDETDTAKAVNDIYYMTRDATLEDSEWSFAMKEWIGTHLTQDPVWGARNAFSVPPDIIRVVRVEANRGGPFPSAEIGMSDRIRTIYRRPEADWLLQSGVILTDEDAIVCTGIRRIEDEGIFSPLFALAFSANIAMLLSYTVTESNVKFNAMSALYEMYLTKARSRDGLQGSSKRIRNRSLQYVR